MRPLPSCEPPPFVAELAAADPADRPALLAANPPPIAHDGTSTFVHLGPADAVTVRHFMARFPPLPPMRPITPGVHAVTVRLPEGARIEYKLEVIRRGHDTLGLDPHNPRRATDPHGANSVAWGPGYADPWWAAPAPGPAGEVGRGYIESAAFGRRRSLHWYRPAAAGDRLPLVVILDGSDFLHHAGIASVLDNLIAAGAIPPVVAALVDPVDRLIEYTGDPAHAAFLGEVVEAAVRRRGADPDPGRHVFAGASMGAVAALDGAGRRGGVGGLVLLSGSFVTALGGPNRRGAEFAPVIRFMQRFRAAPGRPAARLYQAWGEYEGLAPDNEAFAPLLEATGADLVTAAVPDGHHWHNWRNRLGAALRHTLDPAGAGTVRP